MHHAAGCALTLRSIDGSFMSETKSIPVNASPSAKRSFAAMRHPGFRAQFITFVLAMMADNIEHVISYWMLYQKFHSPALAGFAIVSHWLPFLLFSVASGALADRFDPRRIIQIGMALFIIASLSWSYFFVTGTPQMWQAMVILVIHGCAGVLWQTPNQMLLYDIVGPSDLESAVRLNAMARYLAVLAGPAVGAAILLAFGAAPGIMLNTLFYLPLVLWLVNAPYGPRTREGQPAPRRAAWTRHRPVQHVEPWPARLQRHFGRSAGQPDRCALVSRAIGSRHPGARRWTIGAAVKDGGAALKPLPWSFYC
jgi:MFS family permease